MLGERKFLTKVYLSNGAFCYILAMSQCSKTRVGLPRVPPNSFSFLKINYIYDLWLRTSLRGVSKKFGEWYQKTNKTRYKQINFIFLQNNRHPSQHTVGNVHKASGNCQQRPL